MNSKIGIIGGGQLGLMMIEEAKKLGAKTIVLDPDNNCPSKNIADEFICAKYDDYNALCELGNKCDVITYEFENIPSEILINLENKYNFKQGIKPLFDSQDRLREKENAINNGLNPVNFYNVENIDDLKEGIKKLNYPCVFKTRTLGYDGHGQVVLRDETDIKKVEPYLNNPGILEQFLNFDYEVSIVLLNDGKEIINFPISRNIHKDGILDLCIIPSNMNKELENKIISKSKEFIKKSNYLGIITIEYFIKDNEFYFNEMAPRPHNSGHYTIEGCNTNQFKELVKYLLDIPFEQPVLLSNTIMKNVLGENLEWASNLKEGYLHLYGKKEVREKRKMGHLTLTNCTLEKYLEIEKRGN